MNIKKIINLILIISLTVINIYSSGDKKRRYSYDDSVLPANLIAKKIKLDEEVLAKLAKEKKDLADKKNKEDLDKAQLANKEQNKRLCCEGLLAKFSQEKQQPVKLSCTGLPTAVTKIISQYLECDWYLYSGRDFIHSKYEDGKLTEDQCYKIKKIYFSTDNKTISILGVIEKEEESKETEIIELQKIFNLDTKRFKKYSFIRSLPRTIYSSQRIKDLNCKEDAFGKFNNITLSGLTLSDKIFRFNKEYFPINIIKEGRFALSHDEKYIAFANVNCFIIWHANKFNGELKRENVLKKCNINPEDHDRGFSWINCLSFSRCSNYLAINVNLDNEGSLSFIYDLVNDTLLDVSTGDNLVVSTIEFSTDSKYFAVGSSGDLRIYKRGLE